MFTFAPAMLCTPAFCLSKTYGSKEITMTNVISKALIVGGLALSMLSGCSYGGAAMSADGSKAVVLKSNMFLFGIFNRAYVCKVSDAGLSDCNASQNP